MQKREQIQREMQSRKATLIAHLKQQMQADDPRLLRALEMLRDDGPVDAKLFAEQSQG